MLTTLKRLFPNSLKRFYWRYKKNKERREKKRVSFKDKTPKETFTFIHDTNFWSGTDSVSGGGSDLHHTQILIQELTDLFKEKGFQTVLDIPCGDFVWMQYVDLKNVKYTGGDIVDELIANNISKFGDRSSIKFKVLDLLTDKLPDADVLINRDCLVHLSYQDVFKALRNIQASGCSYLLTTTFPNHEENIDITTGDWRVLNLEKAPFNFPKPILLIHEGFKHADFGDKSLGLWRISDLKDIKIN